MNDEQKVSKYDKLRADHPEIYSKLRYVSCGEGWYDIINLLTLNIEQHLRNFPNVRQVEAVQIKEKFGGLRFYYDGGDDFVRGLTSMAESMSVCTCEECGAPGNRGNTDNSTWISTLCDPCRSRLAEERRKETERLRILQAQRKAEKEKADDHQGK